MLFRTIKFQERHKFVRELKKYLNELVQPSPNLPDDDVLDMTTLQALKQFKTQWYSRISIPLTTDDPYFEVNLKVWTAIGLALGKDRLLQELQNTQDYELRGLLLGLGTVNAIKVYYTKEMEECDAKIASILGGDNAIAAANGFEPYSLALVTASNTAYHYYRAEHLNKYIMHLYGSKDRTRFGVDGETYTDIFIPDGFEPTSRNDAGGRKNALTQIPSPTEAVVTFYYKKLGNVDDVTLTLMHVKDFKPVKKGNRWHIGKIGGKGGQSVDLSKPYLHSHFALLRGDVGLSIKLSKDGSTDSEATFRYRESIGVRFADAFC